MKIHKFDTFNEQYNNKKYYTTSYPMSISDFIEIEVEERENYDIDEVEEWQHKYGITGKSELLWVAETPWVAARYQMPAGDWDNAKTIYKMDPDSYNVQEININAGTIIDESDDGDGGYLMVLK